MILRGLSELIFPYGLKCPFCGSLALGKNDPLCKQCRNQIEETCNGFRPCAKCGRYIPKGHSFCQECGGEKIFPFILARAISPYEGVLKEKIHLYKYLKKRSLAEPLACLMLKVLKDEKSFQAMDAIIAVPLHANRLHERTFNQSEELARVLALKLNIPFFDNVLWRAIDTPTQVNLNKKQRHENLKNAFRLINGDDIKNKNMLLIDDIFTTGATVSEISKVLLNAGASCVAVLTLATGKITKM